MTKWQKRYATDSAFRKKHIAEVGAWYRKNKARKKSYDKKWRSGRKGVTAATIRRYYEQNRNAIRCYLNEWQNKWRKTPKGRISNRIAKSHRRKRIRETKDGTVTADAVLALLVNQLFICAICKTSITARTGHIDHRLALANGGCHTISNIQWLCAKCNLNKSYKRKQRVI